MRTERTFIGVLLTLFAVALLTACSPQTQSTQTGRAVFTMTDAAENMSGVTAVIVTVDSVRVLNESGSWIEVSTTPHTYDLLRLKADDTRALLADYNLTPGVYRQVRLVVSKVIITDAAGNHTAKLPSGELKLVGNLTIAANSTSTANFDFIADESLHLTGTGLYIFAPVIQLETREHATVDMRSRENVRVSGGRIIDNRKLSMDLDGSVGEGLRIGPDERLAFEGGKIAREPVRRVI